MSFLSSLERLLSKPQQKQKLNIRGRTEDGQMVAGPQGYVPINADIKNFQTRPVNGPEDGGLIEGQQGYLPMTVPTHLGTMPSMQALQASYTNPQQVQNFRNVQGSYGIGLNALQGNFETPTRNKQIRRLR